MSPSLRLFASAPRGIEPLLADELRALGAGNVKETRAGVTFDGDLALAYRVCLWSRVANRVLLPLAQFPAATPEALYAGVRGIDWAEHLDQNGTLAVDFNTYRSAITHTHYGALKVKDAVVDQFRERTGVRPSVATDEPDVRINVYVHADVASLSIDLSGESLHRRGYRVDTVTAPLKENLAAAILLRAGWPAIARAGGALVDLMCGSGTLPIEAALIASDSAPGLDRTYYGFLCWHGHDVAIWEALLAEAHARRAAGIKNLPPIRGYDSDPAAVRVALVNVERAGLTGRVHIERRYLADCRSEHVEHVGLVVVNPPYGERLGEESELPGLYRVLGEVLKRCYEGWRAAVFTGNPELGKVMGLRAHKMHVLYNGAIECKLLHFEVIPKQFVTDRGPPQGDAPVPRDAGSAERPVEHLPAQVPAVLTPGAEMFANRLRKNLKQLGKWAEREKIYCYRLYDADMPEYALAIDLYQGAARWAHVQEYAAPKSIDPDKASERLQEALSAIPGVLGIPAEQIFLKVRQRQKGSAQYERLAERGEFHEVQEDGLKLLVNFTDYLDTGLFLDHRLTRRILREQAKDKRFLNLFGYTGAATVHAAVGARATTTVDMSRTYLDWARRNLALNGFEGPQHELIQADVLVWLEEEAERCYDLIFLDPPTFSTSKRMQDTLDIQRDHVALIQAAGRLLSHGGTLIFSTNFRRFRLEREGLAEFAVEDISRATIPKDFERNPRIHQCFKLTRRS
jgi:23S rRNA (guanine2445-N2)-methyltransferase / 23S rRNA (guanine2069-N7)-methyltransferase